MYAYSGYAEGKNGQSIGKAVAGLYTIRAGTGEFIGGGKGITRRALHIMDYFTVAEWIIGLVTGRTYACLVRTQHLPHQCKQPLTGGTNAGIAARLWPDGEDRRDVCPFHPRQARLAASSDDHRRVLAVLAYLRAPGGA